MSEVGFRYLNPLDPSVQVVIGCFAIAKNITDDFWCIKDIDHKTINDDMEDEKYKDTPDNIDFQVVHKPHYAEKTKKVQF